jgi:uncharacterized Zn finger protein
MVNTHGANNMPRRASMKPAAGGKQPEPTAELRKTLSRQRKATLVDVLLELAQGDRGVLRQLTARFDVAATADELCTNTRQDIADATHFDKRDLNRNFAYDYEAYAEVKRNLGRLLEAGHWRQAMDLALELMKQGSHQVEMSDEGMMTEDIQECLSVVIGACKRCDLPAGEILAWCKAMLDNDRVGFISREPLEALLEQLQTNAARR